MSKRRRAGAVVLAAAAMLAWGPLPQAGAVAEPVAGGVYQLVVATSGKCADVVDHSTVNGAQLQQWTCNNNSPWQHFKVTSAGNGRYTLSNINSGRCIDVPNGATTQGLRLQQWGCGDHNKTNQLWRFAPSGTGTGTGTYQIISIASGLCMSDQNASTTNGAALIQETCTHNSNKQWAFTPLSTGRATVAADGSGTYRTVQAAVDAVPAGNAGRVTITIAPGTYREIVRIPSNKPYVTLQGLGSSAAQTVIVNNHHAGEYGTSGSATAFIDGHDFIAENLTISNDFDENSAPSGHQAVALNLGADRARLTNVRLLGDQDTFLVNDSARAYISDSYVEGTVDFIFGGGIAVFDDSDIREKRSTGGPITAASTAAGRTYGFLFYRSRITGASAAGTTTLGRPWRPDAQVLYRECSLSSVINTSAPWTNMSDNDWRNARFFEYRNTGSGATINSNRPQLTDAQAADHTPQKYLAGSDGWNPL
ncbi:pectinesterase family protein [Nonomuraea sp. B10E15]|uniref:pectinesterase family protein n=1 Tax=Nonomuraea sp. B10E15 TaxID=3153560 RepID=UPI00325F2703